jgi:hypothetical protein
MPQAQVRLAILRYALALLQPPVVRADGPTVDSITVHFVVNDEDKETEGSFDVEVEKGGKRIVKKEGWGAGQLWKDRNTDDLDHEFTASVDGTVPLKGRYVLKSKLKGENVDVCGMYYIEVVDSKGQVYKSPMAKHIEHNPDNTEFEMKFDIP